MNFIIKPKQVEIKETKKNSNIQSFNNFINKSLNNIDYNKHSSISKTPIDNAINHNVFYNINFSNKEEIINRSNEFDKNFSWKSILFNKEKTIHLIRENDNKEKEKDKDENKAKLEDNAIEEKINSSKYMDESFYNFNFGKNSKKCLLWKKKKRKKQ